MRNSKACTLALSLGVLVASCLLPLHSVVGLEKHVRTIVIFGDTQSLSHNADDASYQNFGSMIDWVLENRESQNIDFVLHVGDLINQGSYLPLPTQCIDEGVGCVRGRKVRGTECGCYALAYTRAQWQRFNRQWKRLDGVVPYAIVRGNHDNVGIDDPNSLIDTPGFMQFFGADEMRKLPGYVETYSSENLDAHAWKFRLGDQEVLVIGPSYAPSARQLGWVRDVMARHRETPVIILTHEVNTTGNRTELWENVISDRQNAEQILMVSQGHYIGVQKTILTVGKSRILKTLTNWQGKESPHGSYLSLIRFFFNSEGSTEVEAETFSPVLGDASRRVSLHRQPLAIRTESR